MLLCQDVVVLEEAFLTGQFPISPGPSCNSSNMWNITSSLETRSSISLVLNLGSFACVRIRSDVRGPRHAKPLLRDCDIGQHEAS